MSEIDYTDLTHTIATPRSRKLTREEFEWECVARSGGTIEQLREYHEINECDCGAADCPGWKAEYLLENKRRRRSS